MDDFFFLLEGSDSTSVDCTLFRKLSVISQVLHTTKASVCKDNNSGSDGLGFSSSVVRSAL